MINSFTGEYRFLSNFWPSKVILDEESYPTVENAYQAAKTEQRELRSVFKECTPGQSKKLGQQLKIRSDWEQIKFTIMEDLLVKKFKDPELQKRLLETGDQELVEGNVWGDKIWGVYNGIGENHLGKLLMKIRGTLR